MTTFLEGGSFERWNDPNGNPLAAVNRDGTVLAQGINLPSAKIKTASVTLTSAQFKSLGTSPLAIVPGVAGKYLQPISPFLFINFPYGGTPYTDPSTGSNIAIASGNDFTEALNAGGFWIVPFAGYFDAVSSFAISIPPVDISGTFPTENLGAPLLMSSYDSQDAPVDFLGGNTPVTVTFLYMEL
jgi:hypothetical protein